MTTPSRSEGAPTARIDWDARLPASLVLGGTLVAVHVGTALRAVHLGRAGWLAAFFLPRSTSMRVMAGGQLRRLVEEGEVWRAFTAAWLHGDALHLLVNVVAIGAIGRFLEPWVGPVRLWAWFWLAALGGALLTHVAGVRMTDGASAGAFGLLGAAAVLGWRWRDRMDAADRWMVTRVLPGFVLVNLVVSFLLPFINAAGHVGGLLVGLAIGAAWRGPSRAGTWLQAAFVLACLAIVTWGFVGRRL